MGAILFSVLWVLAMEGGCPDRIANAAHVLAPLSDRQRDVSLRFIRAIFRTPVPPSGHDDPLYMDRVALAAVQEVLAAASSKPQQNLALLKNFRDGTWVPEAVFVTHQMPEFQKETAHYLGSRPLRPAVVALATPEFSIVEKAYADAVDLVMPSAGGELNLKANVGSALVLGGYCKGCMSLTVEQLIKNYQGVPEQEVILHPSHIYAEPIADRSDSSPVLVASELKRKSGAIALDDFLEIDNVEKNTDQTIKAEGPTRVQTSYGAGQRWRVYRQKPRRPVSIIVLDTN